MWLVSETMINIFPRWHMVFACFKTPLPQWDVPYQCLPSDCSLLTPQSNTTHGAEVGLNAMSLNFYGNHKVMDYDSSVIYENMKVEPPVHASNQIPPLNLRSRIPGQKKLRGNSQLEFPNYTLIPGIAGELGGVGSHRTQNWHEELCIIYLLH